VLPVFLSLIFALPLPLLKPGPVVSYTVTIDPADTTRIRVAMVIQSATSPVTHVAMAVHPEYNDRFWRYIRDLHAEVFEKRNGGRGSGKPLTITADDDHSWSVPTPTGSTIVTYRIQLPPESPTNRPVWHSTLRSNGASLNSTDTFLYLRDFPRSPVAVGLRIPDNWQVRSGLSCEVRRMASGTLSCASDDATKVLDATTLLDSPILLGALRTWTFTVRGVPHHVVYWPLPNATPFDTNDFVSSIEKFAQQTFALFGKAPYTSYTFMLEDGAYGGLEHANSVTIGARSSDLAKDPRANMPEIAHEFFHTWNLMALNPRGVLTATANPPLHTRELWWSEGVTIYYAETLQRRAGIPEAGKTRMKELEEELDIFHGNSGNSVVSPERGSWASIDPPDLNTGDYLSNYYTQGRLIGYALDIIINDSTRGRRGMDDVMRLMYDRFAKRSAFTGADIERATAEVCQCNVHQFFEDHVRNAKPIDFDPILAPLGLHVLLATSPAADSTGTRFPDLRISAYTPPTGRMRVRIIDPRTVWTSAGLHTGMEWVSLNGIQIDSFPDFRRAIRSIKLGDTVQAEVVREGKPQKLSVRVTGYDRTRARAMEIPDATPAQLERRSRWLSGH
jgi:predicted metalloprotease with PDZ domain